MVDQVGGDELEALLRADDGGQLRPLRLQAFLAFDLLAFGDLLEVGVDLGAFGLREFQLRQPAFVVDRHRGAVFDRASDVVDADVVAEDRPRVRPREAGRRQGVAHVAGETVDEVALAAVGLVGDDDATAADAELLAQVGPVGGLDGILALESIR